MILIKEKKKKIITNAQNQDKQGQQIGLSNDKDWEGVMIPNEDGKGHYIRIRNHTTWELATTRNENE